MGSARSLANQKLYHAALHRRKLRFGVHQDVLVYSWVLQSP